jgi:hypothetical protein
MSVQTCYAKVSAMSGALDRKTIYQAVSITKSKKGVEYDET